MGKQRAAHHLGPARALALDHHARRGAHDGRRIHAEQPPAFGGDLRRLGEQVHLRKQHQLFGRVGVQADALGLEQPAEAVAQGGFVVAPAQPPGDAHPEAVLGQPAQAGQSRLPGPRAALFLVQLAPVVVHRDPQHQPFAVAPPQRQQRFGALHHWAHGVGEHQRAMAGAQAVLHHAGQVRVHERLAAGEADLLGAEAECGDFIQIGARFGAVDVRETVVARTRLDVAVGTGEVAQRAGVEPQRAQLAEGHGGAALAFGGAVGVRELPARGGDGDDGNGHRGTAPRHRRRVETSHAHPAFSLPRMATPGRSTTKTGGERIKGRARRRARLAARPWLPRRWPFPR